MVLRKTQQDTSGGLLPASRRRKRIYSWSPLVATISFGTLIMVFVSRNLRQLSSFEMAPPHDLLADVMMDLPPVWYLQSATPPPPLRKTVAYAVTITDYNQTQLQDANVYLLDRAAVLHQSIKLAHLTSAASPSSPSGGSRYDYVIFAFVHPRAARIAPILTRLGYQVQIRDTPFNISDIPNPDLITAQENSCCEEREYLKLYSYTLLDYPVVVHLDLDGLVLRSMDDVFDIMLMTTTTTTDEEAETEATIPFTSSPRQRLIERNATMWHKDLPDLPHRLDFLYTRDYNMVDPQDPPHRLPYQIGVQGGFLVVRPNLRDYDRMLEIIRTGGHGYTIPDGWGGSELGYGGYYGAGTIQGLASYYYGHYEHHNRSLELNRCYYNTMVDNPYHIDRETHVKRCRTLEPNLTCQDCRKTQLEDVYTAHFTVCGKPDWCSIRPDKQFRLCMELFEQWHNVRSSLEDEWAARFPGYRAELFQVNALESQESQLLAMMGGHCQAPGGYIPMKFPAENATSAWIET